MFENIVSSKIIQLRIDVPTNITYSLVYVGIIDLVIFLTIIVLPIQQNFAARNEKHTGHRSPQNYSINAASCSIYHVRFKLFFMRFVVIIILSSYRYLQSIGSLCKTIPIKQIYLPTIVGYPKHFRPANMCNVKNKYIIISIIVKHPFCQINNNNNTLKNRKMYGPKYNYYKQCVMCVFKYL